MYIHAYMGTYIQTDRPTYICTCAVCEALLKVHTLPLFTMSGSQDKINGH